MKRINKILIGLAGISFISQILWEIKFWNNSFMFDFHHAFTITTIFLVVVNLIITLLDV